MTTREEYDWVINKLRSRGFKTLQDRRYEAEEQRKASEPPTWWSDLRTLPGGATSGRKLEDIPDEFLNEEQREEKRIREKWGGTLAETVPISDLKTISEKGYIPRSQSTCFRCGQLGHWSRDCPMNTRRKPEEDILTKDRSALRGRDARMYDKALLEKREREHYHKYS